jgi:Uma2 family endonuclease
MATNTLISKAEYLRTSFESPEPDYVDGELVERPVPNTFHAGTQILLSDAFQPWQAQRQLFRYSELRLQVAPERFRVADFTVFTSPQREPIPKDPPYVIVEIVSPDDRYDEIMGKLADYQQAGVEFLFIADLRFRRLSRYDGGSLITVAALDLPAYQFKIPAESLFD